MSRGVIIEPDENGLYGGVVIYGPDGITPISSTNPLNVSLTGSKLTQSIQQPVMNIASGQQSQILLYASAGKLAHLKFVGIYIPGIAAATTGLQSVYVTVGTNSAYQDIRLINNPSSSATTSVDIKSSDNSVAVVNAVFSDTIPLCITIFNNTNATQTGTAFIEVNYEEATF